MTQHDPIAGQPADGRTAQLLEQLMQIARVSALEEMASGMAHELNQPIGAITTFAQAAERMLTKPEPMTQAAIEVLRHISNEAMNAGQGLHRIRRLFEGHLASRAQCTIEDVVDELAPVLQWLARRAGMQLDISIQPSLPRIFIDRLRIQHVLFALVQNALEAVSPGGQAPQVRVEINGDRYFVATTVIDRGAGVAQEAQAQMFRPFFTTKPNGTGLGLASARAIVEMHNGTIGFDNAESGGARFWFRLPVVNDLDTD